MTRTAKYILQALLTVAALAIGWMSRAQAPASPAINCMTVVDNGNIFLSWSTPSDPSGWGTGFRIVRLINGGPLEEEVTVLNNFGLTNYTVTAYDGTVDSECFYIQTIYNNGTPQTAAPGPSFCSVHLGLNASVVPGIVQLLWNHPWDGPPTPGGTIDIYLEFPAGVVNFIHSIPTDTGVNAYSYEVSVCSAQLDFFVVYNGISPCASVSNTAGGVFQDQIDPSAPLFTSVSVDSLSNQALLTWEPPPQADVDGYIIYECQPGFNPVPLDTIFGANILSWTNPESQANLGVEFYNIAAFDSCLLASGDPDPGAANLSCASTIYLTHQWQPCSDDVQLIWTPYTDWADGVALYEIYVAEEPIPGSGIFNPSFTLAVVDGNTASYTHENVNLGSSYRYRVKAVANNTAWEASSNRRTATVFYPAAPAFTYIREVNPIDRNLVEIVVEIGPGSATEHIYSLERKRAGSEAFDFRVALTANGAGELTFLDEVAGTDENIYTYRVGVSNSCGDEIDQSNIGTTILLSGFVNRADLSNVIDWSDYLDWDNGVERYEIYRWVGNQEFPNLLVTLAGGITSYVDQVGDLLNTPGEFCYRITAVENGNGYTLPGLPESNRLCLTQEPVIWVPNAFLINGFNTVFKPVISFANPENYRLQVYSRWGNMIFQTDDLTEGWNGEYRGERVPEGMYAWFLSISDGAGRIYEERGTVMMMVGAED